MTVSDFAKLLGVEYGEEFQFVDTDGTKYNSKYRLTEEGLECFNEYTNTWGDYDLNIDFIFNKNVVKKPWKPKNGDRYFVVSMIDDTILMQTWADATYDYLSYAAKNCFKTEEEAEKHKDEVIKYLKSVYDSGKR